MLSQEQYIFLHTAVLDALVCKDTEIPLVKFAAELSKLKRQDDSSGLTGVQAQYQLLSEVTSNPDDVIKETAESNYQKNRTNKFLPCKNGNFEPL